MAADFHRRFEIQVGLDEAKRRFVNRCFNLIFNNNDFVGNYEFKATLRSAVATELGERLGEKSFEDLVKGHFLLTLRAIEAVAEVASNGWGQHFHAKLASHLEETIP